MLKKIFFSLPIVCLLTMLAGCYYSYPNKTDHWTAASREAVDSVRFYIAHHYWTGYNLQAVDSLTLYAAPPLAAESDYAAAVGDSLTIRRRSDLVVARVMYVPADTVDSVWVKVAHDQLTQGWVRESTLLEKAVPDDPISKFIYHFSGKRAAVVLTLLGLAVALALVQRVRKKPGRMVHFRDIPSFYPTLLCLCVSGSAALYGSMQKFVPATWVEFYYHPTLNPFNGHLPLILALFIGSVWIMLIVAVAVADEVRRLPDLGGNLSYLASLGGVCVVLYLVFTLTTPLYIGYPLLAAYWAFALWRYWKHRPTHWVCGACGRPIAQRGICPHCGRENF